MKKCSFFKEEADYLGFTINQNGVKPNPEKVEAIRFIPPPSSVKEVRSFVGCVSFYRRFIPGFSRIAEPLINLTRSMQNSNGLLNASPHLTFSRTV